MFTPMIHKLIRGEDLTGNEMEQAMSHAIEGKATSAQIGSFVTALRMKGETVEEITAAARLIRSQIHMLELDMDILNLDRDDINIEAETISKTSDMSQSGTKTFSVSTATAFVVAAGGVNAVRHSNRAINKYLGIADVLENLGINLELSRSDVENCIKEVGLGFLFSAHMNGPMKKVSAIRREIGMRTIFNLVTPIINPAGATMHMLGVYRPGMTDKIAHALKNLGAREAFVVCGDETYDEISICGATKISHLKNNDVTSIVVEPEDFGLERVDRDAIRGKDAANNAAIIRSVLEGEMGPRRDVVLLNAAAAFVVAGKEHDMKAGIQRAAHVVDSGLAGQKLKEVVKFTADCVPYLRKVL